jgi:hypothetical protein
MVAVDAGLMAKETTTVAPIGTPTVKTSAVVVAVVLSWTEPMLATTGSAIG